MSVRTAKPGSKIRAIGFMVIAATACGLPAVPTTEAHAAGRVVSGARVDLQRFGDLWGFAVALVRSGSDPALGDFCAGTLVASDVVVTAARCVADLAPADLYVYSGSNTLVGPYPAAQHRAVSEIAIHPNFDGVIADVALLRMAQPVRGSTAPLPAPGQDVGAGTPAQVAGWGCTRLRFRSGGTSVDVNCDQDTPTLHEASAPVVDENECEQNYSGIAGGYDRNTQRCAGTVSAVGSAGGPCYGDTGSPLVVRTSVGVRLVGVMSYSFLCGYYPSVYADVIALRGFLDQTQAAWANTSAPPAVPPPPEPPDTVVPGTSLGTTTPVTPTRLVDTRTSFPLEPGVVRILKVGGFGGVPLTTAASASLNVTAVDPAGDGYLTAFPCGQSPPLASNLNYRRGETVANAVEVGLSADGDVCFVSLAATDLVVDVTGWSSGKLDSDDVGARLTPVAPVRLRDTRITGPKPAAGDVLRLDVTSVAPPALINGVIEIPTAVTLNLTAVDAVADGYLTAFPCGSVPLASNVNYRADEAPVSNAVVVPTLLTETATGTIAEICILTYATAHVVVDATGWYGLPLAVRGGRSVPVTPTRLIDTRETTLVEAGTARRVPVVGRAGVPTGATGAIVNVTAVDPRAAGYLTAYACDQPVPGTSTVNHDAGVDVPTLAYAPLSAAGELCVLSYADSDVVVDITGYVAP